MKIKGSTTIAGAGIGLVLGGPLGAVIGGIAGWYGGGLVNKWRGIPEKSDAAVTAGHASEVHVPTGGVLRVETPALDNAGSVQVTADPALGRILSPWNYGSAFMWPTQSGPITVAWTAYSSGSGPRVGAPRKVTINVIVDPPAG